MFNDEKQFEHYIHDLPLDDAPDAAHREALEARLRETLAGQGRQSRATTGRLIMQSRITKWAAAAAVLIVVLGLGIFLPSNQSLTLAQILKADDIGTNKLFLSGKIVHIINEIIVHSHSVERTARKPEAVGLDPDMHEEVETINSWLDHGWVPISSLEASGQFRIHQLTLPTNVDEAYVITDQSWYDPESGRFARVMKDGDKVIFANSFDGENVYFTEVDPSGGLQLIPEAVAADFQPPKKPAGFLGIGAGLRGSLDELSNQPVQEIKDEVLEDGMEVRTYKLGFADLLGEMDTYWLFRVRRDNQTIAEMEFVQRGASQLTLRRALTESVETTEVSWNLAEIDQQLAGAQGVNGVSITPDMVIPDVTVEHMVEKAGYATYVFSKDPSWTSERIIIDVLDPASPPYRMFILMYKAAEGRDVVLVHSQTYNTFFGPFLSQDDPIYTSPRGFKVWTGGPEKWWTNITLKGAGLTPAEDRRGFIVGTPVGTYLALAINGPLGEEEMHPLIDSIIPAKEYKE